MTHQTEDPARKALQVESLITAAQAFVGDGENTGIQCYLLERAQEISASLNKTLEDRKLGPA
ncbi:MAG: hypothetical protein RLO15_07130 [Parvibaculum sp.]|uniref:hypothetical protein n=1 Tax=Roseovarius sp. TaxID=1486281 RepID=UPI0032F03C56